MGSSTGSQIHVERKTQKGVTINKLMTFCAVDVPHLSVIVQWLHV